MTEHDDLALSNALRARVSDETTDLDALASAALRRGKRTRLFRYTGAGVAAAAVVAAGVVGVTSMTGGNGTPRAVDPAASKTPTAPASTKPATPTLTVGQVFDLGHHVTATIQACASMEPVKNPKVKDAPGHPKFADKECVPPAGVNVTESSSLAGAGSGYVALLTGSADNVESLDTATSTKGMKAIMHGRYFTFLDTYPGIAIGVGDALYQALYPSYSDGHGVTIHLAGWKQVGSVGDDKQMLKGPHGAVADIVWRDAKDYSSWVGSSDKGATAGVWTSTVHDGVFVSIQGGQGTTDADLQALGASLTWN